METEKSKVVDETPVVEKTPAQICAEEVSEVLKKHNMVARIGHQIIFEPAPVAKKEE